MHLRHPGGCKTVAWQGSLEAHARVLVDAPDHLYRSHGPFATVAPAPLFDVPTALEIACRGTMELPSFIADLAPPPPPTQHERDAVTRECNALVLHMLRTAHLPPGVAVCTVRSPLQHALPPPTRAVIGARAAALVECGDRWTTISAQVERGVAFLACAKQYEASLVLEPAIEAPFDVVLHDVLGAGQRRDPGAARAATRPNVLEVAVDDGSPGPDAVAPAQRLAEIEDQLQQCGVNREAYQSSLSRWRWRLVNVALQAGAQGTGGGATAAQLAFLRAELDFRMLNMRHAALVHHLRRLIDEARSGDVSQMSSPMPPQGAAAMPGGALAAVSGEPGTPSDGGGDAAARALTLELQRAAEEV